MALIRPGDSVIIIIKRSVAVHVAGKQGGTADYSSLVMTFVMTRDFLLKMIIRRKCGKNFNAYDREYFAKKILILHRANEFPRGWLICFAVCAENVVNSFYAAGKIPFTGLPRRGADAYVLGMEAEYENHIKRRLGKRV